MNIKFIAAARAIIIAGESSGVGKTTIAMGLMAALKKRGITVQPFKTGPDYIDPFYHNSVCSRPSYNLDTWMMGVHEVKRTFESAMSGADIGIVEGVMGLFDGRDGKTEEGSTAHLAKVLNLGVILVVDASKMARSVAALVSGFEKFDKGVKIAGVIFNRVGSERHCKILKESVEMNCSAKVLGFLPRDENVVIPERHLGLVIPHITNQEGGRTTIDRFSTLIEKLFDIEGILKLRGSIETESPEEKKTLSYRSSGFSSRIAVAYDDAFCFYYRQNLDILKELGAEIIFFSPLSDKRLPERTAGIYFGGGYPELYAKKLELNRSIRKSVKDLADKGFPIYAECGGLMYLGKGLKDLKGTEHEMIGLFPWVSRMRERVKSLGYREVEVIESCPFLKKGEKIRGHEFHYSEINEPPDRIKRSYRITHPASHTTAFEGYFYKNTLASYIHLHFANNPRFAKGFVKLSSETLCRK